ncbi:hypothetical protein [Chryseobacterium lathyri]|uniref:hypothetical protein n=1 Tax=Chryseobacterium lathyri TaxID=395933 RepID=UPI0027827F8C|nr:hypothetical protein [Chryseobacterium lathyri]MDQ0065704.1 hypothetical protein [Chryseobacterium lathyri]
MKKISLHGTLRNAVAFLMTALLLGFVSSCSKDDDDGDAGGGAVSEGANYKITVTLNGVNSTDDYVSVVASGSDHQNNSSIWKINGTVQNGQTAVGLNDNSFAGSTQTYIIETNSPIAALSASIQVVNFNSSITGTYKIEKNGTTVVNENINLTTNGADFTKQYSFN